MILYNLYQTLEIVTLATGVLWFLSFCLVMTVRPGYNGERDTPLEKSLGYIFLTTLVFTLFVAVSFFTLLIVDIWI